LLSEIDAEDKDKEHELKKTAYKKTCLKQYMKVFVEFVKKLETSRKENKTKRVIKDEKMEF